jgi:hypothetical protein
LGKGRTHEGSFSEKGKRRSVISEFGLPGFQATSEP